ncbi:MAG: methionine--tRNA ligase [bacterium]|nr:methionine--tRNA ligase [bacterium]
MSDRYLVTSALPYANGKLHIGQIAGAYLPADIYVRYLRLKGREVVYICGSDEHGVPVTVTADKEGKTPREVVDYYHNNIEETFARFGMSFDNYGRTSDEKHHYPLAQRFFSELLDAGYVSTDVREQHYCEHCVRFLPDRYVNGVCPNCGSDARGDQCDECGRWLSALELEEPRCAICGEEPIIKKTKHWYIELPKFAPFLKEWLDRKTDWKDNVRRFCNGWLDEGLQKRAITRDLSWGVPVPLDEAEGKVLYVWFDAPIGYISSTMEWAEKRGDPDLWKRYWYTDDDLRLVHFIGKDNIVFHAMVWPSMLNGQTSANYRLPDEIPANEFLNLEGKQMSTSRDWAVWLDELLDDFQPDSVRYALAANLPENRDTDFTFRDFGNRVNGELAGIFGNFINRSLGFAVKYLDNEIPEKGKFTEADEALLAKVETRLIKTGEAIEVFHIRDALAEAMGIARDANLYYQEQEPWARRKDDPERCATILWTSLKVAGILSTTMEPFTPFAAARIREMLGIAEPLGWDRVMEYEPESGRELGKVEVLVQTIDDEVVEEQVRRLEEKSAAAIVKQEEEGEMEQKAEKKLEYVTFDDINKLGLKVAEILECEKVEGADKLLKIQIDIGGEKRQIIAGIAPWYEAESLVGRKIVVITNMQPAKIRGVESNGMLLAASVNDDEDVQLIIPDNDAPAGSGVN